MPRLVVEVASLQPTVTVDLVPAPVIEAGDILDLSLIHI